MHLSISPQQLAALNAEHAEQHKRAFLLQAHATWESNFPRLMPGTAALPRPDVLRYLDQGYELCIAHGVRQKPLILQFLYALLRAAHLDCSTVFIQEMCQYFVRRECGYELALEWMDYVLSGGFQRDLAPGITP